MMTRLILHWRKRGMEAPQKDVIKCNIQRAAINVMGKDNENTIVTKQMI